MSVLNVDPAVLIDSFEYCQLLEKDEYGKEIYQAPIFIDRVRIDRTSVFSRTGKERRLMANGIIFCFASATEPFLEFKERSKVKFDNREYTIEKVIINKEPYRNAIWSYELEVV